MAIMSFVHLKNKKHPEKGNTVNSVSGPSSFSDVSVAGSGISSGSASSRVLSFARLKKQSKPSSISSLATNQAVDHSGSHRTTFKLPRVMPLALLHATNYCFGCGRFIPAENWEKRHGNHYGRCRRDDIVDDEGRRWEVWRVISGVVSVGQCWFLRDQ